MSRFLLVIAVLGVAAPARANVGRGSFPGTRATEPPGLHDIAIESEELRFDLRPLGGGGVAEVSATYHLNNRGATITAPLVFVSGARVDRDIELTFDRSAVRGGVVSREALATLPASWRAPLATPAIDGGTSLGYESEDAAATAFTLTISPGQHDLVVTYGASPQSNRSKSGGTLLYQLGYVLAPARDWGAFGTLDVSLQVPAGWLVAVSPALDRTGDTLHGRFPSLPADTIGITLQAPTGALHDVLQIALPVLVLVVLGGGGFALFAIGRARGRRADHLMPLWPTSLPLSLLWAVAIGVSGGLAAIRSGLALPAGQSALYGYGAGFGILLAVVVALIAIPVGFAIVRAGSKSTSGV